jgi:hypothetical protein
MPAKVLSTGGVGVRTCKISQIEMDDFTLLSIVAVLPKEKQYPACRFHSQG